MIGDVRYIPDSPQVRTTFISINGVEFVLEGLHLTRRLGKDVTDSGRTVYGGRG